MSVNGDAVVQYSPNACGDWYNYNPADHDEEVGASKRIRDDSLPSYFLKERRTIVAILDVQPLRRHCCIPSEIPDEILCEWLRTLDTDSWTLEDQYSCFYQLKPRIKRIDKFNNIWNITEKRSNNLTKQQHSCKT
jgi:hypothetical protein